MKNLVLRLLTQKGPKMRSKEVFKYYEKSVDGTFLIFSMKLHRHKELKFMWIIFLGKTCFEDFEPKGVQSGPKKRFSGYFQKSMHGTFLIFLHEVTAASRRNINQRLTFWEKLCSEDFGLKVSKMSPKRGFSSFVKNQSLELFWFFTRSYNNIEASYWLKSCFEEKFCTGVFRQKVAQ